MCSCNGGLQTTIFPIPFAVIILYFLPPLLTHIMPISLQWYWSIVVDHYHVNQGFLLINMFIWDKAITHVVISRVCVTHLTAEWLQNGEYNKSLVLTVPITIYRYRLNEEKAEWIIYVTDVGQQQHFDMVFRVCIQSLNSCMIFSFMHIVINLSALTDKKINLSAVVCNCWTAIWSNCFISQGLVPLLIDQKTHLLLYFRLPNAQVGSKLRVTHILKLATWVSDLFLEKMGSAFELATLKWFG